MLGVNPELGVAGGLGPGVLHPALPGRPLVGQRRRGAVPQAGQQGQKKRGGGSSEGRHVGSAASVSQWQVARRLW